MPYYRYGVTIYPGYFADRAIDPDIQEAVDTATRYLVASLDAGQAGTAYTTLPGGARISIARGPKGGLYGSVSWPGDEHDAPNMFYPCEEEGCRQEPHFHVSDWYREGR